MSNYLTIRSFAVGGVQPNLNLTVVKETAIPLPPLTEQEQIVSEVEVRLSNIEQLEATTLANIKRAEHERQSILREAFAGRLVPQDSEDEPASVLLERIREERKKREEAKKIVKVSRKGNSMESIKKRQMNKSNSDQQEVDLYKTLLAAKQPLPPHELFERTGLKIDEQPESVETFYVKLDDDIRTNLIEVMGSNDTQVLLKAIEQSPEQMAAMEQEEDFVDEEVMPHIEKPTLWDM